MPLGFKGHPTNDAVQGQVANQHDHVVEHDGVGRGMQHDVCHALRLTKVNNNKEAAHDHSGDCHEFSEDDHDLELFVVMEVGGKHKHHGRGSNTDQIGKLGDVQAPRHVAAHTGNAQTIKELEEIDNAANRYDSDQEEQPHIIALRAFEYFFNHGRTP